MTIEDSLYWKYTRVPLYKKGADGGKYVMYGKTCLQRTLKNRQNKGLKDKW